MRILIIINNELTLYNFRQEFLQLLVSDGNEVYIATPKGKYRSLFESFGCNVIEYELSQRGMNPLKDFRLPWRYKRIIKSVNPDAVLTYTIKPNIYGGIACNWTHKPYIATITGLGSAFEKGSTVAKVSFFLYKLGLKKVSKVFFQNSAHEQLFAGKGLAEGRHVVVSGSGVNLTKHCFEPYPSEENDIKFLFVGRVTKDKGVDELFEAFSKIRETYPEKKVHLGILGNTEEGYDSVVQELDKQDAFSFYGRHENVHDYVKEVHAVVLPSYHEGMANVLLEAAACGRPVIASLIPGCRETFDNGVTGIGCEARSVDSLYNALDSFVKMDENQHREMGRKGREKVEKEFDRDKVNATYLRVIKEIVFKGSWNNESCTN